MSRILANAPHLQRLRPKLCFHYLFVSLLLLIVLPPHMEGVIGVAITEAMLSLVMLSSLYLVVEQKRSLYVGIALFLPAMFLSWNEVYIGQQFAHYVPAAANIVFFGFVSIQIFRYLIKQLHPNTEMVLAATSLYLILGVLWAFIYAALELKYPGSFNLGARIDSGTFSELLSDMVYFSFVTLTTLGYGDISPQNSFSESWVVLEAVLGQFYVAIVLARILGLYVARELDEESNGSDEN
ncbi:potassium channel family protein [Corallincola platygyrae]|uniref:Potassium channel family protein n=1 Tax=Corallincola platygyrae TaxID=1193278 RepID=A0ABW4XJ50_9GAMM